MNKHDNTIAIRARWTKSGIPTPQMLIDAAAAGMVSRKDEPYGEFVEEIDVPRAKSFLKKMIKYGHDSVLEHVVFQFWLSMSRVASHQLVRHRMASYTQMSLRQERDLSIEDFVIPPEIKDEDREEWKQDIQATIDRYRKWLDKGYDIDTARRRISQDARTDLVMTINARSLRNFFDLRAKHDADFEIREVARKMYKLIQEEELSFLFEDIGFD